MSDKDVVFVAYPAAHAALSDTIMESVRRVNALPIPRRARGQADRAEPGAGGLHRRAGGGAIQAGPLPVLSSRVALEYCSCSTSVDRTPRFRWARREPAVRPSCRLRAAIVASFLGHTTSNQGGHL